MNPFHDLRYVFRSLARSPGFAIAVVLTLGLGIGANTAVFSVVRGVLLRPLPHRDFDRLVYLRHSAELGGVENALFSVPEIIDYREGSPTLAGVAEFSALAFNMVGNGEPVIVTAGIVTGNYFDVMGLSVVAGRPFQASDDGPGAVPVMALTYDFWVRAFGADPGVIGTTVRVNGRSLTIVGIVQPAPSYPEETDILVNMVTSPHHMSASMVQGRTHRMTEVFARLTPNATIETAQSEIDRVSARIHGDHRESYDSASGFQVKATPLRDALTGRARLTLYLLMGTAAFVLIIACANVANLSLMRHLRRERELAVRWAMGAAGGKLRRLLLTENLVLAFAGALLGLGLGYAGLRGLVAFAERFTPRAGEIALDGGVLAFAIGIALVAAVMFTYAPSLPGSASGSAALIGGGKRSTMGAAGQRMQRGLVVAQVAVTMVVLIGAGLLLRTLANLNDVDVGVDLNNVLTMEVPIDGPGLNSAQRLGLYEQMRDRVAALPGVSDAALGSTIPLRSSGFMLEVKADGRPPVAGEAIPRAEYRTATPEYFRAAGIPFLKGRAFESTDRTGSQRVVILNKTLADRLFPDRDPIGQRVAWTGDVLRFIPVSGDWRTVVGVVADTKDGSIDAAPPPVLFQPFAQDEVFTGGFVIKTQTDAASLAAPTRRIIRELLPEQPIERVLTLEQIREESVAPRRLNAFLVGAFGALALVLAAVGIGAVLAFSVSRRTAEIGIRMSLGAGPRRVVKMILKEGGVLLGVGLVIGIAGSLILSRFLGGLLYGVVPNDPVTLIGVLFLMALVGVAASLIPAARAARVDPAIAMRVE